MKMIDALGHPLPTPAQFSTTTASPAVPRLGDMWLLADSSEDQSLVVIAGVGAAHVTAWLLTIPGPGDAAPAFRLTVPGMGMLTCWPEAEVSIPWLALGRQVAKPLTYAHVLALATHHPSRAAGVGIAMCPASGTDASWDAFDAVCAEAWRLADHPWAGQPLLAG